MRRYGTYSDHHALRQLRQMERRIEMYKITASTVQSRLENLAEVRDRLKKKALSLDIKMKKLKTYEQRNVRTFHFLIKLPFSQYLFFSCIAHEATGYPKFYYGEHEDEKVLCTAPTVDYHTHSDLDVKL